MVNRLKSTLASLLYIVICLIIFGSVNWISVVFLTWFSGTYFEKQLVAFLMLGSLIWMLFIALRNLLINFSVSIGLRKSFAIALLAVFSIVNGCVLIEDTWELPVRLNFKEVLSATLLTLLIIEITIAPLQDLPGLLRNIFRKRQE